MINEFQKYPENKRQYDRNYIRAHGGKKCKKCKGSGRLLGNWLGIGVTVDCPKCNGLGWVSKKKKGK